MVVFFGLWQAMLKDHEMRTKVCVENDGADGLKEKPYASKVTDPNHPMVTSFFVDYRKE